DPHRAPRVGGGAAGFPAHVVGRRRHALEAVRSRPRSRRGAGAARRRAGPGRHAMTRILIVDDDQDIARILRFRLEKKGFECVLAGNGFEALEVLDKHHPDLVLLDVMMPKMDGFTACREIRKRNAWARIPVIMLTAKGDTSDKVNGITEGADDYVVKPFE